MDKKAKILVAVFVSLCLILAVAVAILSGFLASSNGKVAELEDEQEMLEERVINVGKVACMMEAYGLSSNARVSECNSIVKFITEEKTNDEIKDLLYKTNPYLYRS